MTESSSDTSAPTVNESDDDSVHRAHHDMTEGELTVTIATALADATNVDAKHIIADFSDYVDPDGLNRLFRVPAGEEPRESGYVHLTIAGHEVTIHSNGDIEITE